MKKFNKEKLEFFLPEKFKGLSKKYILHCVFNEKIQKLWKPQIGDIIVGQTGNVFVISGHHTGHESVGGDSYLFGGSFCNRNGGHLMDSTHCFVMNKDGLQYTHYEDIEGPYNNLNWSKIEDYRYVPYPHELIYLL